VILVAMGGVMGLIAVVALLFVVVSAPPANGARTPTGVYCGAGVGNCSIKPEGVKPEPEIFRAVEPGKYILLGTDITLDYDIAADEFAVSWKGFTHIKLDWDAATQDALDWAAKLRAVGIKP
jgi:hypothetical protein